MLQKYVYAALPFRQFVRGLIPSRSSSYVEPNKNGSKQYVWRNSPDESYKIAADVYSQIPQDLSNLLLVRTRERQLLQNRVHAPFKVLSSGKNSVLSADSVNKSLKAVEREIEDHLPLLVRQIKIANAENQDYSAAFASNSLYVLEKNGVRDVSLYEQTLIPILKKKAQYLHAEGVSQSIWALSNAQIWEKEIWDTLKKLAVSKNYDVEYVSNSRWSIVNFIKQTGREHIFQNELTPLANQLFFQDKLNLFELYNSLVHAQQQNPQLGLQDTIKTLETRYADILKHNQAFLDIDRTHLDLQHDQAAKLAAKEAHNA